jgi:uncharacterized protein YndB with AHSA1/START domain
MSKPEFVYVTYIKTTPEKLWQALVEPGFSEKYWMGCRAESDWKVGSPVVYHLPDGKGIAFKGEVLTYDPPHVLSYTFEDVAGGYNEQATRVVFEIVQSDDVVKLTVSHDQFQPGSKMIEGISQGWPAVLSGLKTLLESGAPMTKDGSRFSSCKSAQTAA